MLKKQKRKSKLPPRSGNQCDRCAVRFCRIEKQQACARREFDAIAAGERYECPDREAGYWERMEAA